MNRNFGKLNEGAIEYAPDTLTIDERKVYHPKAVHYRIAGYLPVVDASPSDPPREGYHYSPDGWEARDGAIRRTWREEANPPPPPRTFSKLRCVSALMAAGVWQQVKGYITEAGLYDLFLAAQDFREDNAYFADGRSRLQTALGWSDEQVEAVLAASVAGEA